jgi:hypothetical protein
MVVVLESLRLGELTLSVIHTSRFLFLSLWRDTCIGSIHLVESRRPMGCDDNVDAELLGIRVHTCPNFVKVAPNLI